MLIGKNIEYIHEIQANNTDTRNTLLEILISYKRIRSNIDNTDIIFKLLGESFSLEDVRAVYELVSQKQVDKSNFRKKIMKYCEKINKTENVGGFRPSQQYSFKPLKGDAWI